MFEKFKLFVNLFKVRISLTIVLCAISGAFIVPNNNLTMLDIFLISISTFLASAGVSAFNQYFERDLDALMPRTSKRPFVTGELKPTILWPLLFLIISLFEKKTSGLYHNSSIVINEKGKLLGKYRKMHIPDDPQFYEKFYFAPGDLGFKSFKTSKGNLGTLICWDQWFPEAARLTSLQGAEILFYPTAIGWHPKEKKRYGKSQLNSWISVQRSHAIANGVYVAAVNRVGVEKQGSKKLEFWGNTIVFDPSGNIIAEAKLGEKTVICDIDFKQVENVRRHWPFFRDRRIDYYKGILNNPKDA